MGSGEVAMLILASHFLFPFSNYIFYPRPGFLGKVSFVMIVPITAFSREISQRASASVLIVANIVSFTALVEKVPVIYHVAEVSVRIIKVHFPCVSFDSITEIVLLVFRKTMSGCGEFEI